MRGYKICHDDNLKFKEAGIKYKLLFQKYKIKLNYKTKNKLLYEIVFDKRKPRDGFVEV